jgi:hypothetical protein
MALENAMALARGQSGAIVSTCAPQALSSKNIFSRDPAQSNGLAQNRPLLRQLVLNS